MRPLDYAVVGCYLAAVFGVGVVSRGRKQTVDDYFGAHGTFRGPLGTVIIGLSIAASFFSGISFIVYSSFAYSSGTQLLSGLIGLVAAWIALKFWFLPRYWAAGNRHPYDVVERRFGYVVRASLSVMFVLLRIGWMAVIIYAPSLIIMGALGLGQAWFWPIVAAVGGFCTFLAVIGGVRGVIFTDAIQFLVILVGLLFVIISILARLHGTPGALIGELRSAGHLQFLDFSLSFTAPWTVWAVVIGQTTANAAMYYSDQMALQRYLASESEEAASRSFSINVVGVFGVLGLLTTVGLLLCLWYRHHPDPRLPANADQILPYFAARELPAGMSGLLIAAVLAATMNALTSGINSLAGAITNDFLTRTSRPRPPAELLRAARLLSAGLGLLATLSAGVASQLGSVLVSMNIILGAFRGPMLACILFVLLPGRFRPSAVLAGMILGTLIGIAVATTGASSFWVCPAGFVAAMAIPLLASLRWSAPHSTR